MIPNHSPEVAKTTARRPISLALQGGGSWGAYTWGVLDALLASRSIAITQITGTSAGAINAAIVVSALTNGSPSDARQALRGFWTRLAAPSLVDVAGAAWGPIERAWHEAIRSWLSSNAAVSPYTSNPLGVNPLRAALEACIDIDAIRHASAPALYVTVTNVKTGLPRIISNADMSIDALLASACLPQLFQAVELDGECYWDGGYGGNPTLWPLIHSGNANDLILVQLAQDSVVEVPKDAASIQNRINEIVFNSSLVAEMQAIAALRAVAARSDAVSPISNLRVHRIGPPRRELCQQGSSSERSRAWLDRLFVEGRGAARDFLSRQGAKIGVKDTLDIAEVFTDGRKPKLRVARAPLLAPSLRDSRPHAVRSRVVADQPPATSSQLDQALPSMSATVPADACAHDA
jgi:NTE family protein